MLGGKVCTPNIQPIVLSKNPIMSLNPHVMFRYQKSSVALRCCQPYIFDAMLLPLVTLSSTLPKYFMHCSRIKGYTIVGADKKRSEMRHNDCYPL